MRSSGGPVGRPVIYTRREFLAATAATAALVAGGGVLGACTKDAGREPPAGTGSPPSTSERATRTTRTTGTPTRPPTDPLTRVASVAVHPAIGIARVGNSADSFFFGPELPGRLPVAPDGFKDASGAIARQAARFRIYGYDAAGDVVGELTAAEATITWTVSVANKKAAWYDFDRAMDLPQAAPVKRRNVDVTGAARDRLVVATGAQSISGPAAEPIALDDGRFLGEPVPLGELLTDERGRLVFVPAEGRGYSPGKAPLTTFADNNGWADDTCDGPVLATVTIGERTMDAVPGWIVVTPPNYGPGLRAGLITAYDSSRLGWDTFDAGGLTAADVSFRDEILPILGRIVDMQWVNAGFLGSNGWGSGADYLAPDLIDRLADPSPASAALRRRTFEQFRNPDHPSNQGAATPRMYGDGGSSAQSRYRWLTVTPIQYALLRAWAAGTFTDDRDRPVPSDLAALSPRGQTFALDRAGLDACLGGAYHPGIEVPWTLRVQSMWSGAGRLRVRSTTVENLDYGDELTPERAMAVDGPLAGSGPGDLTRWLGTPWHGDAASCRAGYQPEVSTVLPTFWPARIPNHVLREVDYLVVVDTTASMADRQAAFARRFDWERFVVAADHDQTLRNMVRHWGRARARHRAAGADRWRVSGGDAGGDECRLRPRADRYLECSMAGNRSDGVGRRAGHDAVVIGGGPAGSAAAATLARIGRSVLLIVDRHRGRSFRVGEGAPPGLDRAVDEVFGANTFLAAEHLRSLGNRAAWGTSELTQTDFMFSPFGTGWHLDRVAFDASLLAAAVGSGVTVRSLADVGAADIAAPVVIDASGRRAGHARRHGARPNRRRPADGRARNLRTRRRRQRRHHDGGGHRDRVVVHVSDPTSSASGRLPHRRRPARHHASHDLAASIATPAEPSTSPPSSATARRRSRSRRPPTPRASSPCTATAGWPPATPLPASTPCRRRGSSPRC